MPTKTGGGTSGTTSYQSVASKEALKALAAGEYQKVLLALATTGIAANTPFSLDSVTAPNSKVIWPRVHFRHWFNMVDTTAEGGPLVVSVQKIRTGESPMDPANTDYMEDLRNEGRLFHWSIVWINPLKPVKLDLVFYNIKPEEQESLVLRCVSPKAFAAGDVQQYGYTEYSTVALE